MNPHTVFTATHHLGSLSVDMSFTLSQPWTVLFGPSGSGKSTILRALAGFVKPDRGTISLCAQAVYDTHQSIAIPPAARPIAWAGQQTTLFPHLTIRENLAFGLPRATPLLDQAIDHFDLAALAPMRPAQLSGGQQQRIAVVRAAIRSHNRILLLDEPFSGQDAPTRLALVESLRQWIGHTPVILVTHDIEEPFLLDAEVLRIQDGKLLAQGPPHQVLAAERTRLQQVLA